MDERWWMLNAKEPPLIGKFGLRIISKAKQLKGKD